MLTYLCKVGYINGKKRSAAHSSHPASKRRDCNNENTFIWSELGGTPSGQLRNCSLQTKPTSTFNFSSLGCCYVLLLCHICSSWKLQVKMQTLTLSIYFENYELFLFFDLLKTFIIKKLFSSTYISSYYWNMAQLDSNNGNMPSGWQRWRL